MKDVYTFSKKVEFVYRFFRFNFYLMFSGNEFHRCVPGEIGLCFQILLEFIMLDQGMSMFVVGNGGTDAVLMFLLLTLEQSRWSL